jgi:hypothetical protein
MAETGEEPWTPPRPPSYTAVWGGSDLPTAPVPGVTHPGSPEPPSRSPGAAREKKSGAVQAFWLRISMGRRVAVSYLALALAIVVVASIGTALQPSYSALTPWHGITVDDLRGSPQTRAWSVDLAETLAPGSPAECLRFTGVDVRQNLALVRADSAWSEGFREDVLCSMVPAGFRSRVALLDTASGQIQWVHDVAADFATRQGVSVLSTTTFDHGSRILIQSATGSESMLETLSTETGRRLQSAAPSAWTQDDRFAASGDVVATGSLSTDGLSYVFRLRNANDLGTVVWSGAENETSTMIALSDRLLLGNAATEQIPLTTGVPTPWGSPVDTSLGYAVHGDVVFVTNTRGEGVTTVATKGFTAVDKTGRVLWKSDLSLRGTASLTRSCLAVTDGIGSRLSCLDYATGKILWTRDGDGFAFSGGALGQQSDDIFGTAVSGPSQVVDLDAKTGREKFRAGVPPGSTVVAAGRSVGYALAYGVSGSRSNVIAFDLSSGHTLWTHASQLQLVLWGGHLIDIDNDGLGRRLGP